MINLPTRGGILTTSQFHHLFPKVPLEGTEFELALDNGQFATYFSGFYTVDEINVIKADLVTVQGVYEKFKELLDEAERRMAFDLGDAIDDVSQEVKRRLRWTYLKLVRMEEGFDE